MLGKFIYHEWYQLKRSCEEIKKQLQCWGSVGGGGGGSSNCRLSVKVPLLCWKSVKNFRPLSVVGKSQLINENAWQVLMSVMYFTQFHDFNPYKTCWTCNNASFDWTSTPLTSVCLIYETWSFISPLIDWLFISPLASRTFALGVDKTRNMEHPGTFRNIPEHPGTYRNMKKLRYFLWKNNSLIK